MAKNLRIVSVISEKCNYDCSHCSTSSSQASSARVVTKDLISLLQDYSDFEGKTIHTVSGGEPTLNPDLTQILQSSLDLGYDTCVITNCWWVKPEDPDRTKRYLEKKIPKGVKISASFDFPHQEIDPQILDRLYLLKDVSGERNPLTITGAYNGPSEHFMMKALLTEFDSVSLVPMQSMGNAIDIENLNSCDSSNCPKGLNKGFVVTPKGVFYCIRGAMNNIPHLRLGELLDPNTQSDLSNFKFRRLLSDVRNAKNSGNYNSACDGCEALNHPEGHYSN